MNLFEALDAARQRRKEISRSNEKIRKAILDAVQQARNSDDRWSADFPRDEPMGIANHTLYVAYRTSHLYESETVSLKLRLVVRDGGEIDIYDATGRLVATDRGADSALNTVARLVAEFEWPNDQQEHPASHAR